MSSSDKTKREGKKKNQDDFYLDFVDSRAFESLKSKVSRLAPPERHQRLVFVAATGKLQERYSRNASGGPVRQTDEPDERCAAKRAGDAGSGCLYQYAMMYISPASSQFN